MKKSCLLISPPDIGHDLPRGLLELASFLEASGVSCQILLLAYELSYQRIGGVFGPIDEPQTELLLRDALQQTQAAVVGVSNQHAPNYPDCLKILELCKQIDPGLVTVMGGPHVTFLDAEAVANPFVDVVVRGEGEWTLRDLIAAVEEGRDLASVQGITFQRDGQIIRTLDQPLGDLNDLPPVNFGLFPDDFVRQAAIYGTLSRGCSFPCSFCAESIFWKKRRRHPVQRLIDEMLTLRQDYGRPMDAIEGSMIAIGSRQSLELCSELVANKIELPPDFYTYTRVDTITDEGMQAMKQAGILNLWVGVESASQQVLTMMNKHISYDQTIAACQRLRDNGLFTRSLWVIGHPGDNPEEAALSLTELKRLYNQQLIAEAQPALFIPYPGTQFYDQPEKYGMQILSYDWRRWERWSGKPIHQLDDFSADQIMEFYEKTRQVVHARYKLENFLKNRKTEGDQLHEETSLRIVC